MRSLVVRTQGGNTRHRLTNVSHRCLVINGWCCFHMVFHKLHKGTPPDAAQHIEWHLLAAIRVAIIITFSSRMQDGDPPDNLSTRSSASTMGSSLSCSCSRCALSAAGSRPPPPNVPPPLEKGVLGVELPPAACAAAAAHLEMEVSITRLACGWVV